MALINSKINDWILKKPTHIKDIFMMVYSPTSIDVISIDEKMLYRGVGYANKNDFIANEDDYGIALLNGLFKPRTRTELYFRPFDFIDGMETILDVVTHSKIDVTLFNNYGDRKLLKNMFPYLIGWDKTSDEMNYVVNCLYDNIYECISNNYYKWKNLYKSCVLEFNPLWNVDGTEETTRTLEQDGTIQNKKRGSDSIAHDETNQYKRTGTDATKHTGTNTNVKSGTETVDSFEETTQANSGNDVETLAKTTTESATFYDAERNTKANGLRIETSNDKTDTTTHNTTDTETIDLTDTTTHNTTDSETKDIDTLTSYNNDDTMTRDLLDTERILLKRYGNIGVTTTTKLLNEFREYVNFNLGKIIAHDIANSISEYIY